MKYIPVTSCVHESHPYNDFQIATIMYCRVIGKAVSNISGRVGSRWRMTVIQRNPLKDTLNRGDLSNEDTVCSSNHIELCTNLPLN